MTNRRKRKHHDSEHIEHCVTKRRAIDDKFMNNSIYHSASSVHNYVLNDPILDIFKLVHNYNYNYSLNPFNSSASINYNKSYDEEYSLLNDFFTLGHQFESFIINKLRQEYNCIIEQVCYKKEDNETKKYHDLTTELLKKETPIIYQGALKSVENDQLKFYGSPDIIIKISELKKIIKSLNTDISDKFNDYYTIVDIKYTGIELKADKKGLLNKGRMKANQSQVSIYWYLLNSQKRFIKELKVFDKAFILGRSCTVNNLEYGPFEYLGYVNVDEYIKDLQGVYNWLTYSKKLCNDFLTNMSKNAGNDDTADTTETVTDIVDKVVKLCIDNKIRPNMCNSYDGPYNFLKKYIASKTHEITSVYNISYKTRNILIENKVEKWSDPNFLEILNNTCKNKYHASDILKNIIEVNTTATTTMTDINKEELNLIYNSDKLEQFKKKIVGKECYFLDIETTSGIWTKDFSTNRHLKTTFLIGIMNTSQEYTSFLIKGQEYDIYEDAYKHIFTDAQQKGRSIKDIIIFHWGHIEKYYTQKVYPEIDTSILCDLYKEVVNIELASKSCFKYGLKSVFNSLLSNGNVSLDHGIKQSVMKSGLNGLKASIEADKYYQTSSTNFNIMHDIINYNRLDCLMLFKIYDLLITLSTR